VYFVSVGDYDAKIGNIETWQKPQWKAAIPTATADLLAKQVKLPADAIPSKSQVETFVDNDFPRPAADDIYFTRKSDIVVPNEPSAAPARRIPPIAIPPVAVPPILAGLGLLVAMRRRRNVRPDAAN
jgi:hypothetical protein